MTGGQADAGAARQRDAAAAGALHDFNNAVQATSASLRWLERRVTRGDIGDLVGMIAAMVDQVTRIGSLGAALARSSHACGPAVEAAIPVTVFVHAMAHQVSALLDGHIRLKLQVDADAGHVSCDPARLESAIRNLVLNARDAMPQGGELLLRGRMVDPGQEPDLDGDDRPPARCAAITVADTGRGMDAKLLRRCFEPFVTTKATADGNGLGLFQLRAFTKEMGGAVRLQSRVGHGTQVTILLPCATPSRQ